MNQQLVYDSTAELTQAVAQRLRQKLQELSSRPRVRILLTGGTLGIQLLQSLSELDLDLKNVTFYFGDERFVGLTDPDRNEAQGLAVWPHLANNLHRYPDTSMNLDQAQVLFNTQIEQDLGPLHGPGAVFDICILGMGPDGHVASLFPGAVHEPSWIVSEHGSPKPPSERLSFSYEALNRSDEVWFLVSGESKAQAVGCALSGGCDLPVAKVKGVTATLWFMDQELRRAL